MLRQVSTERVSSRPREGGDLSEVSQLRRAKATLGPSLALSFLPPPSGHSRCWRLRAQTPPQVRPQYSHHPHGGRSRHSAAPGRDSRAAVGGGWQEREGSGNLLRGHSETSSSLGQSPSGTRGLVGSRQGAGASRPPGETRPEGEGLAPAGSGLPPSIEGAGKGVTPRRGTPQAIGPVGLRCGEGWARSPGPGWRAWAVLRPGGPPSPHVQMGA